MWCAGCKTDVAVEVSPETNRARCATCGRELALTNTRNDALSRIDAGQIDDGISPPHPHSSPADQLAVSEGSKNYPLLKTIQGSSAGISAQISNSVTDARLLLERWTRENLLDPQEKPSSRSSEKSSTSDISQSSTSASETSSTKREQPRSTLLPDPSQPDVITRVITESSKTGRPPQPHNELPPPPAARRETEKRRQQNSLERRRDENSCGEQFRTSSQVRRAISYQGERTGLQRQADRRHVVATRIELDG